MIKIIDVKLSTTFTWDDIKQRMPTWQEVNNGCANWGRITQTCLVGQEISIEVDLFENDWSGAVKLYQTWQGVKIGTSSWQSLKNF